MVSSDGAAEDLVVASRFRAVMAVGAISRCDHTHRCSSFTVVAFRAGFAGGLCFKILVGARWALEHHNSVGGAVHTLVARSIARRVTNVAGRASDDSVNRVGAERAVCTGGAHLTAGAVRSTEVGVIVADTAFSHGQGLFNAVVTLVTKLAGGTVSWCGGSRSTNAEVAGETAEFQAGNAVEARRAESLHILRASNCGVAQVAVRAQNGRRGTLRAVELIRARVAIVILNGLQRTVEASGALCASALTGRILVVSNRARSRG